MKVSRWIAAIVLLLIVAAGAVFYRNPIWVSFEMVRYHLWRAGVRSEYVEAGGHRLHYFEAGPANGKPLLLVHGLGSHGEDWSPMIPKLAAAGFHVYAPDLLGYGRSDAPDVAYSISLEEGVVIDFMRAVGLTRADVGGWSMGGWIAAKLGIEHPAMVDRLVLYDSAGLTYATPFTRDVFVPTDAASLNKLRALLSPKPAALPGFALRAALRRVHEVGPVIQQTMDSMLSGVDLLDKTLPSLSEPTLIVWGTDDALIPFSVGQAMHRDIRGSELVGIEGCGHLAPGECSEPVVAATIEFLKAQPAPQGGEKMVAGGME